ncbi:MAG: type IV pilus twitching motility protein PilT [Proteobacteria bacterium]|nr:type IV pilus twitching motility protein PilT [Pseudomonadota bacterium]
MAELDYDAILTNALNQGASDVHLKAGVPPIIRLQGELIHLKGFEPLRPDELARVAFAIMNENQKETFKEKHQVDLGYSISGVGRFRVNAFLQRGAVGIVFRIIPLNIKNFKELHLPPVIQKLSEEMRGLVLVTGITGSGKSTTLASMVDHINKTRSCHIMSIEDPIEYAHRDQKSVINQREIGVDAPSFAESLKAALRQDPDVILVGEMRDLETIDIALTAAETGHLVLSTLHTIDATETINRIVAAFPPFQQKQIRIQLAGILKGVISQRLIPTKDGKERVPAIEVMVSNSRIRSCIIDKDKTKEIVDAIFKGQHTYQMQTFDQSIMQLLGQQLITYEEALKQSSNPDDFALKVKGGVISSTGSEYDEFSDSTEKAADATEFPESDDDEIERF